MTWFPFRAFPSATRAPGSLVYGLPLSPPPGAEKGLTNNWYLGKGGKVPQDCSWTRGSPATPGPGARSAGDNPDCLAQLRGKARFWGCASHTDPFSLPPTPPSHQKGL